MKFSIYYQPFELNVMASLTGILNLNSEKAVLISVHNSDIENKTELADAIFEVFNWVDQDPDSTVSDTSVFKKVGHTSMSVGDYIQFDDGDIWQCASIGWKKISRRCE